MLWHLLSGNSLADETGEHSLGMCGQPVTDGHSATTKLDDVECMPCLRAEILWQKRLLRRVELIARGDEEKDNTEREEIRAAIQSPEAPHAV